MWIAYIDESSEDERKYLSMAAVLCGESAIPILSKALDEIVMRAAQEHGIAADAELHTTDMISRVNGWERLPDVDAAIAIVHEVLDVICGTEEIQIVTRGLNVEKQRQKSYKEYWGARRVAMQHVLEHCNDTMRTRGSFIVVADEMAKPDEHRDLLRVYRDSGTPGFRHSRLERIVDNIYFMPSHYTRGIQAADIVANVHRRWYMDILRGETESRSAVATTAMWAKLWDSRKVRAYGCWP